MEIFHTVELVASVKHQRPSKFPKYLYYFQDLGGKKKKKNILDLSQSSDLNKVKRWSFCIGELHPLSIKEYTYIFPAISITFNSAKFQK